jgi:sugar/nucleoside kinase (ribokinase family)
MGSLPRVLPAGARPFDFVAVGECSLDLLCVLPRFPRQDDKTRVTERVELPGGQAATAAVACARLGWRSRYVGAIGSDRAGTHVRRALEAEGVDVHAVVKTDAATRSAVVLVDQSSGRRTILEARDDRLDVGDHEIRSEVFGSGRIVLVDGSDPRLSLRAAREARTAGARTLVDIDRASDGVVDLLRHIDVVIAPAPLVHELSGCAALDQALRELAASSGAAAVVATAGPDGAVVWGGGVMTRIAAPPTKVVDSTGAGDAFRGGFAAGWLSSAGEVADLIGITRFAARVAAWNCRTLGAQAGLPTLADLHSDRPGVL